MINIGIVAGRTNKATRFLRNDIHSEIKFERNQFFKETSSWNIDFWANLD